MGPRVCLGAFAGAHGVKGEAKVRTFTETEDGVSSYGAVESSDGRRRFTLKFIRVLKPGLALVSAPEIASREDAEALAGVELYVERARLPAPAEGEFYLEDLVGLAAVDDEGIPLGRIVAFYNFGAGDILEFEGADGRKSMLPFTRDTAPAVDLRAGVVTIAASALDADAAAERD
jgi:16S rRNA processing protein RimM